MKTIWKWILGVVIVLLVVGAFFAAGFFMRTHMLAGAPAVVQMHPGWNGGPMMRGDEYGWRAGPMMRGGRGFGGMFFLGGLGWLARLVFFGLLLYGAYWLGRRNARVVVDPRAPTVNGEPPAEPTPPAPPA